MKSARMFQAQQAVQLIKVCYLFVEFRLCNYPFLLTVQDPESESRPHFAVKLKVSTEAIRIADSTAGVSIVAYTCTAKYGLFDVPCFGGYYD